jgi:hypothetical protein
VCRPQVVLADAHSKGGSGGPHPQTALREQEAILDGLGGGHLNQPALRHDTRRPA